MRLRTILVLAGAVATLCGSAVASSLGLDPSSVVLRKSDFPARAAYLSNRMPAFTQLAAAGIDAEGAFVAVNIPASGTKYQRIDELVVTAASRAQATKAYGLFKSTFRQDRALASIRVPSYGDEQLALLQSPKLGSKVKLLVRKGRVVWQLEVSGGGLLVIPRTTLLAELKKYAAKQKTRVGAG